MNNYLNSTDQGGYPPLRIIFVRYWYYGQSTTESPELASGVDNGIAPPEHHNFNFHRHYNERLQNEYFTRQILAILIPVTVILVLMLIFLIVVLINPRVAFCITKKRLAERRKKGLLGLIIQRHGPNGTQTQRTRRLGENGNHYVLPATSSTRPKSQTADERSSIYTLPVSGSGERVISYHQPAPRAEPIYTEVTFGQQPISQEIQTV